jgi:photosystem II stability/assembly factor-like uncharacterized protein
LLGYFGFNNDGGSARSQVAREGSDVAPRASSQPGGLQPAAGIEGASISVVAVDPQSPKIVFAGTSRAGLFKSTNGGRRWHSLAIPLSASPIVSLAIAPADPQTVYAGSGSGVFKTTDGGATWAAANDGLFPGKESAYEHEWRLSEGYVQDLVVDPRDAKTVYSGTHQRGVFKSTNGGASWRRVNPVALRSLVLDPNDRETLYVAADGVDWNPTAGIFKSTDGGSTWAPAGLQGEEGDLGGGPNLVAIDPRRPHTLYADRGAGLLKSTDGGSTWHRAGPPGRNVDVLAIDPLDSETLYAGTDGGIFKSTNGGRNWTILHAGRDARDGHEVLVLDPSNPATLYASGDSGVLKSTDSGRSWEVSSAGLTAAEVDKVAAPSRGSAYALVGSQGLFKRTQHGWRRVSGSPAASVLAVDPQSPETLYVVTNDGRISRTRDGGDSWRRLGTLSIPKTARIAALAVDAQNSRTLYVGTADFANSGYDWSSIYKSSDGGATWRTLLGDGLGPRFLSMLAVDPRNPKTLHATGELYYRSDDGGATWETPYVTQNFDIGSPLALDPSEPATMYLGTDGARVFKSVDGGANWRDLNASFEGQSVTALAVNPQARQTVYAGTDGGLFVSLDGGESWRRYDGGDRLAWGIKDLAIDPGGSMLYIGGNAGVFELSLAGR